jgi:hypothetical protein
VERTTVTPEGAFDDDRTTGEENPPTDPMLKVANPELPC